tara:strand:+ start:47 stop:205 length:159 start_codon:yes stop_codon:yes gene_type:complete
MLIKRIKYLYCAMVDAGKRTKDTTAGSIITKHEKIGGQFEINPSPLFVNHRI